MVRAFAFPALFLVAEVTRRRGGLRDPANLPLAVLAITVILLVMAPFENAVSRRYEAEADWRALQTTHDPVSMRRLFERFQDTSLQDPDPPLWAYLWLENHPTLMQRIAMAERYEVAAERRVSAHNLRMADTSRHGRPQAPAPLDGRRDRLRVRGRDDRLPLAPERVVARVLLPDGDHGDADRPRLAAARAGAELLTIAMALTGVAIFGYLATQAVEAIAHEVTGHTRRERRQRRMIDKLENHFIICGYGRVGRRAAEEIAAAGEPFVVLDLNPAALEMARERGVLYIEGGGTDDAPHPRRHRRARGLIASADSDSENVYITLSAHARRPDLTIVARASTSEAEAKLRLAGADRVVRPYAAAGIEMAKLALKPQVAAFLEIATSHGGPDLRFEEIEIHREYPQAGRTIRELRVRSTTGAVIVALRKQDGTFDTTPEPDVALEIGDVLIAIGDEAELRALEDMFAPKAGVGS